MWRSRPLWRRRPLRRSPLRRSKPLRGRPMRRRPLCRSPMRRSPMRRRRGLQLQLYLLPAVGKLPVLPDHPLDTSTFRLHEQTRAVMARLIRFNRTIGVLFAAPPARFTGQRRIAAGRADDVVDKHRIQERPGATSATALLQPGACAASNGDLDWAR